MTEQLTLYLTKS